MKMAKDLSQLRNKRSVNKNVILWLITKAKDHINKGHHEDTLTEIREILQSIKGKEELITELNGRIIDFIEEDKIREDVEEATEFEIKVIEEFLHKYPQKSKSHTPAIQRKKADSTGVKLPKLFIKRFTGEPTEWQQFSDTFKATIDVNTSISKIEKFSYLEGYLGGVAEKCIEGITLSDNNYQNAFHLLEEWYCNKQLIIASHVNKLLWLEKV